MEAGFHYSEDLKKIFRWVVKCEGSTHEDARRRGFPAQHNRAAVLAFARRLSTVLAPLCRAVLLDGEQKIKFCYKHFCVAPVFKLSVELRGSILIYGNRVEPRRCCDLCGPAQRCRSVAGSHSQRFPSQPRSPHSSFSSLAPADDSSPLPYYTEFARFPASNCGISLLHTPYEMERPMQKAN